MMDIIDEWLWEPGWPGRTFSIENKEVSEIMLFIWRITRHVIYEPHVIWSIAIGIVDQ